MYWRCRNPFLRCQIYQGCRLCSLPSHPSLLPPFVFFPSCFLIVNLSLSLLPFLHLSASDLLDAKRDASVFQEPTADWWKYLIGRQAYRQKDRQLGKHGLWNSLLTLHISSFLYSFNVSLPGLRITDMGEVSWKKVSVSLLIIPPLVLFNFSFLFVSNSLLSSSLHSFLHP